MPTMTAAARRTHAQDEYNKNLNQCPGHAILAILSARWTTLVLETLADGPQRHADVSRAVTGASQKMLTQTLRRLERDGLLTRTITPAVPVRVDYELTSMGHELLDLQKQLLQFGKTHINHIHQAQRDYDQHADHKQQPRTETGPARSTHLKAS